MLTSENEAALDFFKVHYKESVERMFAAVSNLYAEYWNDIFHFAIFQDENESWGSAIEHTHKKYLAALKIGQAHNVLELGCGRGGFSMILAQNTEGNVLGIDISRAQLSHANRLKRSNLRFERHDIMKVDDLRETFDAVAYIDAACYLPDKKLAMEKLSRVLEPGARLLLIDWCKQEGLSQTQEELVLYPFMKYWGIPNLETVNSYSKILRRCGFTMIEATDLNDRVKRNWEFGYARGLAAIRELSVRNMPRLLWEGIKWGSEGIRLIKEQFPAAVHIKVGFDVGFLRYVCFVAERNA
jgi:cyclopropane fatty-acyl-phospholipid synthase-like methyltransferase